MADVVMNRSKGAGAQLFLDNPTAGGFMLLEVVEADADVVDHDDLAALLAAAGNVEATDPSAARKVGQTATVTQDNVNDWVDVDMPDQVFTDLAGPAIVAVIPFVEISASDAGRIPATKQDWPITPDGTDVTLELNASGFCRFM